MKGTLSLSFERTGATKRKLYALFPCHIPLPSWRSLINHQTGGVRADGEMMEYH